MGETTFSIREQILGDQDVARAVNESAFGGEAEADLVERLHDDGAALFGLVAEAAGRVVGHVLFSRLPIEMEQGVVPAAALAPLAVIPAWQGRGIGTALRCRERHIAAVVVLGDPEYYGPLGFARRRRRACGPPGRGRM